LCRLVRVNPDAGGQALQFPITTTGASPGIRHAASWRVTQGTRTVNHNVFAYYLDVYFSSFGDDYRLYGVRIHYH